MNEERRDRGSEHKTHFRDTARRILDFVLGSSMSWTLSVLWSFVPLCQAGFVMSQTREKTIKIFWSQAQVYTYTRAPNPVHQIQRFHSQNLPSSHSKYYLQSNDAIDSFISNHAIGAPATSRSVNQTRSQEIRLSDTRIRKQEILGYLEAHALFSGPQD